MKRFATAALLGLVGLLSVGTATAAEPTKSHKDAAESVLQSMNLDKQFESAIDVMLAQRIKTDPRLDPFKDVMKAFFKKHMSYEALKVDLIKMYADTFTESELKELATFYKSPLGKKMIEKQPALIQKGAELGGRKVQENIGELQRMIQETLKDKM